MSSKQLKLFRYFDLPGRGEHITLALTVAGEKWDFEKVDFADWGKLKSDVEKCPLGFLPMMRLECGTWLSQSKAILRYIGDQHNMRGSTASESYKIDMIVSTSCGFLPTFGPYLYGLMKPDDPAQYFKDGCMKIMREVKFCQKVLMDNNGGKDFMVGNKFSIADAMLIPAIDIMFHHVPTFPEMFPGLVQYYQRMKMMPPIGKFYKDRKHDLYPGPKPKYTMTYFPLGGRGEQSAIAIALAGGELTWNAIQFGDWPKLKADEEKCPLGYMPMLKVESTGEELYSSLDILRFLGNEHGMYGKSHLDRAKIDMILDTQDDWKGNTDMEKAKRSLDYVQSLLMVNMMGKGFMVGDSVSIADCAMISSIDSFCVQQPTFAAAYPNLIAYFEHMKAIPQVGKYMAERKYNNAPPS